jgi:hypothetical protein
VSLRKRRAPALLIGAAALVVVLLAGHIAGSTPARAGGTVSISIAAVPEELTIGGSLTVTGRAVQGEAPLGGVALTLEGAPYPYRSFVAIAHAAAAADGSFAFAGLSPPQNTRLRVTADPSATVSPELTVTVDPQVALNARGLGPGRERLSVRIRHTTGTGPPRPAEALWYLARHGSRHFAPAGNSAIRELAPGVAYASVIVNPPTSNFSYRVCLNPSWEAAMGPAAAHGPCPHHAFRLPAPAAKVALQYGGEGHGTPAQPFPSTAAIASAASFLNGRAGATAMAVIDSTGRLSGLHTSAHFETASVIKVMFLAAYLQRLRAAHRGLTSSDRALLYPMIHESNNDAASAVLGVVGEAAVKRVAAEAGMHDYAPGVGWWAFSQTSAADQAQLLWRLGEVMPRQFYPYARGLMSTIEPEQSWGFPPVARPRWQVLFKTGALPSRGLFNEVARLERDGTVFSVAVLTDHDPSQAYGEATIEGVAQHLLGE